MTFQKGDRVELVELHSGQRIVGGFYEGQTGTVIGEAAKDSPMILWDEAIIPKCDPDTKIIKSDCDSKTLKKI